VPLDLFKTPKLFWYRLVLWGFQPFYIRYFRLKAVGLENLPREGPYLMVSNHSHLLDPFFIGALIRKPVFQMASNEFFRKPLMRRFMWAMGAFPRKKGFVDFKSIKYAIQIVRKGFPLIIYPEGGRNWDGETLPILKSTVKLVRLLKVPVVTIVSRGNYLAYPRWADRRRKSRISIQYARPRVFDSSSSDEEIIEHIQRGIYNNDNFTPVKKIRGKRPAQGLTRLLWRCPSCRRIEALREERGTFLTCSGCGAQWEVNLHCFMRATGTEEWKAVKEYADRMFDERELLPVVPENEKVECELEQGEKLFLSSKQVILFNEPRYPHLKRLDTGTLHLTDRRLLFVSGEKDEARSYPYEHIRGRSTERNTIFQIVLDEDIARFQMPFESCYKWELIYDHVRRTGGFRGAE
jgi:1-acyl-sn-glycerol-3-phosphate acyltransferase